MTSLRGIRLNLTKQSRECYYCGVECDLGARQPDPVAPTIEHRVPRSRGGGNCGGNVVLACYRCNSEKRDLTEDEYMAMQAMVALGFEADLAYAEIRATYQDLWREVMMEQSASDRSRGTYTLRQLRRGAR